MFSQPLTPAPASPSPDDAPLVANALFAPPGSAVRRRLLF